jgi:hypothetical protein
MPSERIADLLQIPKDFKWTARYVRFNNLSLTGINKCHPNRVTQNGFGKSSDGENRT